MVQGDGEEQGGKTPEKPVIAGPDKRFSEISARIAAERQEAEAAQSADRAAHDRSSASTWGSAFRLGSEFVAAVLVGGGTRIPDRPVVGHIALRADHHAAGRVCGRHPQHGASRRQGAQGGRQTERRRADDARVPRKREQIVANDPLASVPDQADCRHVQRRRHGIQLHQLRRCSWLPLLAPSARSCFAASRSAQLVPSRMQSIGELWYEFVANMVRQVMGNEGMKFFPFVFTVFSFVLMSNLLGMFPYFFTVTSHVVVTAALAVFIIAHGGRGGAGQARPALLQAVRPVRRADGHPAVHLADRDHLVPVAPGVAVAAPVRQHDGRPHRARKCSPASW